MTKQYRRWQVILGVIGFLLIMGLAGREDMKDAQRLSDDQWFKNDRLPGDVQIHVAECIDTEKAQR